MMVKNDIAMIMDSGTFLVLVYAMISSNANLTMEFSRTLTTDGGIVLSEKNAQ